MFNINLRKLPSQYGEVSVMWSLFLMGVFQKNLIFCYFKKNGVFAKNSWLNFLTSNFSQYI